MTIDQVLKRALKSRNVKLGSDANRHGNIIGRAFWSQSVQKPEGLLAM